MTSTVVLLVDDEVPFVEVMSRRLQKRNTRVVPALTGEEALSRLDECGDIDVVILDMKLPGMDGIDTLREIKRSYPSIEVIILTGHATVESAIQGMQLGAFDYLMKPCDFEELLRKVELAKAKRARLGQKVAEAGAAYVGLRHGD